MIFMELIDICADSIKVLRILKFPSSKNFLLCKKKAGISDLLRRKKANHEEQPVLTFSNHKSFQDMLE